MKGYNKNVILLAMVLTELFISCDSLEYSEDDFCSYHISKDKVVKKFYTGVYSKLILPTWSEVQYIPLNYSFSEPYVELEGPSTVIKRIDCYVDAYQTLRILRKKCYLNRSSEFIKIKVYGHEIDFISMSSNCKLYTLDTIRSYDGDFEIGMDYPGSFCDILCNVRTVRITGQNNCSTFRISGQSDSVKVSFYGKGENMAVDFRNLNYTFLQFNSTQCDEEHNSNYAISYAGSPEKIFFIMDHCRELRYRGTPYLSGSSAGRVYPEF